MSARPPVVVGLDPHGSSDDALWWATDEARATGRPLRLLHAPAATDAGPAAPGPEPLDPVVASAVSSVHTRWPHLVVTGETVTGSAARALVDASAGAALVVIGAHPPGARPAGPWSSALWAALTQQVPMHASCPVVVVPPGSQTAPDPRRTVVVGVDDSRGSWEALRFAADRALVTGETVRVVHAVPGSDGRSRRGVTRPPGTVADRALLAHVVDLARQQWPDVRFEPGLVGGDVVESLQRQASRASLLVVGSRGRGGFAGLLLGSVCSRLVGQTSCPLVVTHAPESLPGGRPAVVVRSELPGRPARPARTAAGSRSRRSVPTTSSPA